MLVEEKTGHLYKANEQSVVPAPWDAPGEHPLWFEWRTRMRALDLSSPLDRKARDAALAYFDGEGRSIAATAGRLAVKRETATRRLERAHRIGWVILGDVPAKAGDKTLPRVCSRRVWWEQEKIGHLYKAIDPCYLTPDQYASESTRKTIEFARAWTRQYVSDVTGAAVREKGLVARLWERMVAMGAL